MRRAVARVEDERRAQERFASTVTVGACIIAAVSWHAMTSAAVSKSDISHHGRKTQIDNNPLRS
jgi:hypothetical protein